MDIESQAEEMLADCVSAGQSARRIDSLESAPQLRQALRALARAQEVHVRTALIDDVVVIARTDSELWYDDAATMRKKLTPPN